MPILGASRTSLPVPKRGTCTAGASLNSAPRDLGFCLVPQGRNQTTDSVIFSYLRRYISVMAA